VKLRKTEVAPTASILKELSSQGLVQLQANLESAEQEVRELRTVRTDQIRNLAKTLTDAWTDPVAVRGDRTFVDDPVCNQLCLDEEFSTLLAHPLLQRLNHIKQLSFSYLVFPSATHTRLSHSLGVCKHVEMALDVVFRNNVVYSADSGNRESIAIGPEERRQFIAKAKSAALLHDIGHGPFGHALDRFIGFIDPQRPMTHPDKNLSREYIAKYLPNYLPRGVYAAELSAILNKGRANLQGWDCFLADLVDPSLDVDRMDYLKRDAHMSGLSMGVTNTTALIERICPYREGNDIVLTYDSSALSYVDDFLRARDLMFRNCYDHPRKVAAERIFTRLVQILIREHGIDVSRVMLLTDEQILTLLALAAIGSTRTKNLLQSLLQNVDYQQIYETGINVQNPQINVWLDHRVRGRGKQAYVELPDTWERTLAETAGLPEESTWQILVVVPAHETSTPVVTGARVLYKTDTGHVTKDVFAALPTLKEHLKELTLDRQKIRVFCDGRLTAQQKERVRIAAADLFSGEVRG